MIRLRTLLYAAFCLLPVSCAAFQGEGALVTPQRPTFSSNTSTTAENTVEFETGMVIDPNDSFALIGTAKWGMGPRSELFITGVPYLYRNLPGPDGDGVGDTIIGMRHRFLDEQGNVPSFGLRLATKLPTGNEDAGLSSGEIDFFPAIIASKEFEEFTLTGYYQMGILGEANDNDTDLQHGLAVAASTAIDERWGLTAEVAAVIEPEADSEAILTTIAGTYAVNPSWQWDAGVVLGLGEDDSDLQLFAGMTFNLGPAGGPRP